MSGNFKGFVISGSGRGGEEGAEATSQAKTTVHAAGSPMFLLSTGLPECGREKVCYSDKKGLMLYVKRYVKEK
jgi:hypothetical protein